MDTLSIDKYQHQYINGKNVGNVAYNRISVFQCYERF